MTVSIVFTFIGADKPGLIEQLSKTVTDNGGNWLESRMSQLAGQFAGIARVQVANSQVSTLTTALRALSGKDLDITIQAEQPAIKPADFRLMRLSLLGNDRPGIVRELSRALASHRINVCEMNTNVTSAPMTGEPLFEASAHIQVPKDLNLELLGDALESIADELGVDIKLED